MAKLFRYRRRSLKTALGITKAKKKILRDSGYYAATKPLRAGKNLERRIKREAGYYSPAMKALRASKVYVGPVQVAGKSSRKKQQAAEDPKKWPDQVVVKVEHGMFNRVPQKQITGVVAQMNEYGYALAGQDRQRRFLRRALTVLAFERTRKK